MKYEAECYFEKEFHKKFEKDIKELMKTKEFRTLKVGKCTELWLTTKDEGKCPFCDGDLRRVVVKIHYQLAKWKVVSSCDLYCSDPGCMKQVDMISLLTKVCDNLSFKKAKLKITILNPITGERTDVL